MSGGFARLARNSTRGVARAIVDLLLVRGPIAIVGRRNTARLLRFLTLRVRLDVANNIDSNGERLVQRAALDEAPRGCRVVVFDVGANVGAWVGALAETATRSRVGPLSVHTFEPDNAAYAVLVQRHRSSERFTFHHNNLAVSDQSGEADLFVVGDAVGINSLHSQAGTSPNRISVKAVTVDDYCAEHQVRGIALLKIDAEGHDLYVMRGARRMLGEGAVRVLQFEYNHRWIYARAFLRDAFELLQPMGYAVGKVTPHGVEVYREWHFELETFREANFVAARTADLSAFPSFQWWGP
jgi:FkbM family methyltransferase